MTGPSMRRLPTPAAGPPRVLRRRAGRPGPGAAAGAAGLSTRARHAPGPGRAPRRPRPGALESFQPEQGEQFKGAPTGLERRRAAQLERDDDIAEDVAPREEQIPLRTGA